MIPNAPAERLEAARRSSPVVAELLACAEELPEVLAVDGESAALEFFIPTQPRPRMRVVVQESESVLIFFYKKSVLAYSRDRFSYGGVILGARTFHRPDFVECVAYLASGFHPEKRPSKLKRAFKYTIED